MAAQKAIQSTLKAWQPYYEQPLTEQDGEDILGNWSAYVSLLSDWANAARNAKTAL